MWIILFFSLIASADEQRMCGHDQIKKSCLYFQSKSSEEYITLSNGQEIKNPMWKAPSVDYSNAYNAEYAIKAQVSLIEKQAEILKVLNEIGKTVKLSDKFKMAFTQVGLNALLGMQFGITLPEALDKEDAKFKSLTVEEFNKLIQIFPEEHRNRLIQIAKRPLDVNVAAGFGMHSQTQNNSAEKSVTPQKKKRVNQIFKQVQDDLIASVSQGKKPSELTPEQQSIIKRIKLIKINHGDKSSVAQHQSCGGFAKYENAYYQGLDHSLNICPAYYDVSAPLIAMLIAHEISHSFDPCYATYSLIEVFLPKTKNKQYALMPTKNGVNQILDILIKAYPSTTVAKGIALESHPMREVFSCLTSKAKFRDVEDYDIKTVAQLNARYKQLDQGLSDEQRAEAEQRIYSELKSNRSCEKLEFVNSQMRETMSDVMGAVAINGYLKRNPLKSDEDKASAVLFNAKNVCKEVTQAGAKGILAGFGVSNKENYTYEHPESLDRVEKIIMQVPEVAKSFECKRNPDYICYDEFFNPSKKLSSSESQSKEGER